MCMIILMVFVIPIQSFAINDTTVTNDGNALSVTKDNHLQTIDSNQEHDVQEITNLLEKYKVSITFLGGLATMTMVLIFMRHFIKLGVLGTEHWALKRNSIMSLLWSGLAAALLGAATTIFAISYNLFK